MTRRTRWRARWARSSGCSRSRSPTPPSRSARSARDGPTPPRCAPTPPPPRGSSRRPRPGGGSGCATGSAPRRSGRWTWTRGRWWCATAAGTSSAGRTPRTPGGCSASTGSPASRPGTSTFAAPEDLDPVQTLEAHLSEGWRYAVEVVIEAPRRDGGPVGAAQDRPARGRRRAAHPTGRQHRRAGLVRRAAGRRRRRLPGRLAARAARGAAGPRPAALRAGAEPA